MNFIIVAEWLLYVNSQCLIDRLGRPSTESCSRISLQRIRSLSLHGTSHPLFSKKRSDFCTTSCNRTVPSGETFEAP